MWTLSDFVDEISPDFTEQCQVASGLGLTLVELAIVRSAESDIRELAITTPSTWASLCSMVRRSSSGDSLAAASPQPRGSGDLGTVMNHRLAGRVWAAGGARFGDPLPLAFAAGRGGPGGARVGGTWRRLRGKSL